MGEGDVEGRRSRIHLHADNQHKHTSQDGVWLSGCRPLAAARAVHLEFVPRPFGQVHILVTLSAVVLFQMASEGQEVVQEVASSLWRLKQHQEKFYQNSVVVKTAPTKSLLRLQSTTMETTETTPRL